MRLHQRAGRRMSARIPFGYRSEDGRLLPHDDEYPILDRILRSTDPPAVVARRLTAEGIRMRGKTWRARDVERILKRGRLAPT